MMTDKDMILAYRALDYIQVGATREERIKATRMVASKAENAEDCRALLDHLGLDPHDRVLS